ncbi:MAG: hypothetical protein DI539_27245 [Flavobacterium psychrophilum]|nr:MAG: hypothetical protein DI539_27245 [Flavobacterium psychrophilum]
MHFNWVLAGLPDSPPTTPIASSDNTLIAVDYSPESLIQPLISIPPAKSKRSPSKKPGIADEGSELRLQVRICGWGSLYCSFLGPKGTAQGIATAA